MYRLPTIPTFVSTVTPDNQYDCRGGNPYHVPAPIPTERPQLYAGGGGAGADSPPLETQINKNPIRD